MYNTECHVLEIEYAALYERSAVSWLRTDLCRNYCGKISRLQIVVMSLKKKVTTAAVLKARQTFICTFDALFRMTAPLCLQK